MASRDTDLDWQIIAENKPFWGVLSQPVYEPDALTEQSLEEFYQSGEVFVRNLYALVRAHLDPDFTPGRVFDFGCGVGRLLLPMARLSDEALGVDIAPGMLKLCSERAQALGLTNVAVQQSDDSLADVNGPFDLVNSYITLQHIPPDRGLRLLETLIGKIAVGGIGSLQLTYGKGRGFFLHEQPQARFYRRHGDQLFDLCPTQHPQPPGHITMYDYDLNSVFALVSLAAGHPVVTLPTNDDNHLGVHLIFKKARSA
ncbi:MAG: class I SAM-dependent methyltransferase [Rhodothalassiaceae bacterium]